MGFKKSHKETSSPENCQDYSQKPQRNCTFRNLASGVTIGMVKFVYQLIEVGRGDSGVGVLVYVREVGWYRCDLCTSWSKSYLYKPATP